MSMQKFLNLLNESADQVHIVQVEMFLTQSENEMIYTATDGKGNYPLANDNSVFFGYEGNDLIKNLDGKPSSHNDETYIFNVDNTGWAVYDDNFEKLSSTFDSVEDAVDEYREMFDEEYSE